MSEEEQAVKAYLTEFSQTWLAASKTKDPVEFESVMEQMGMDTDCLMIRPSGNPADMNTFKAMVADGGMFLMLYDNMLVCCLTSKFSSIHSLSLSHIKYCFQISWSRNRKLLNLPASV